MNSNPKRWFYPAQVFAQFTSDCEKPNRFFEKQENGRENLENTSKQSERNMGADIIQIFETGEITVAPDYAQVIVVCSNLKVA